MWKNKSLLGILLVLSLCGCGVQTQESSETSEEFVVEHDDPENDIEQDIHSPSDEEDIVLSCTGSVRISPYETFDIYDDTYEIQISRIDMWHFTLYFRLYDQKEMIQEIEIPIDFDLRANTIEIPVIITDVNGDGADDFILDYGVSSQMRLGQCLIYNVEKNQYEILEGYDELASPYYDTREGIIWEMRHEEAALYIVNQYKVVDDHLELVACLIEDYGSGHLRYTEQRLIDGEWVVLYENVGESQISLDEWYYH